MVRVVGAAADVSWTKGPPTPQSTRSPGIAAMPLVSVAIGVPGRETARGDRTTRFQPCFWRDFNADART